MCLIIHRPVGKNGKGSNVPNSVIDRNRTANPDGFGLAWRENGALITRRYAPGDFDTFRAQLKELDRRPIEYAAHFRTATHGPKTEDLAHPFVYEDGAGEQVAVLHNGIIDIDTDKHESDTKVFVETVLSKLEARWWANAALEFLVESAIGWSRILVMTARETAIIGKERGVTRGGIWYSCEPLPPAYTWKVLKDETGIVGVGAVSRTNTPVLLPAWATVGASETDKRDYGEPPIETIDVRDWGDPDKVSHTSSDAWWHLGHLVAPIEDDPGAEDHAGAVMCTACGTTGEYYRIEGAVYIDMPHRVLDAGTADTREEATA